MDRRCAITKSGLKLSGRKFRVASILTKIGVPVLAIFTALVISSIAILLSGSSPMKAFSALAVGAFGSRDNFIVTIIKSTPLIIAGLGVALAFRGGLFNIGVEGQLFIGSIAAVIVGTNVDLPKIINVPLILAAGAISGALLAAFSGYLKARFGAHEVITTIMMNFIVLRIITWAIGANGPLRKPSSVVPETRSLLESARLPILIPNTYLHMGIIIALVLAVLVYFFLFRTVWGVEIRTVGKNLNAAKYVGINVNRNIVFTMALSGGLAGLAGAIQVMGIPPYNFTTGFNVGYGFDSLAVAVLGSIHPLGVVFSAFLFGAMDAGSRLMQLRAKVPIDIITLLQGLILMFVAANQIIRSLYHIPAPDKEESVNLTQGWGGS